MRMKAVLKLTGEILWGAFAFLLCVKLSQLVAGDAWGWKNFPSTTHHWATLLTYGLTFGAVWTLGIRLYRRFLARQLEVSHL
jgi:hypothetical protein